MWERLSFDGGATVRLGPKTIRLSDVVSVERSEHAERDFQGVLVMGMVFSFSAALLTIGVFEYGMRERFLLGAFIFFVLGVVSLYEAATASTFRYVQLQIATKSGEVLFTTADPDDATDLELALAQRRA